MSDPFDSADRSYAADQALGDAALRRDRLGEREIHLFLTGEGPVDDRLSRALFADPALRAMFRRIRDRLAQFTLPSLAAASDGAVDTRTFPGGRIELRPARRGGQTYLLLRLDWAMGPLVLVLTRPDGTTLRHPLPATDAAGETLQVLDNVVDASLLAALADPETEGALLPLAEGAP
ncbi:MAG: hypothetical protein GC146_12135 [Limimaricola sp.]|uniref:hypothetical protein n=1 Tax=Limimaricola sp. TaxID=2211665 RepID=UPI001E06BED0|nr:hypothetical protein [Limimaricola sp.]MBI1417963.1 hypothetical protein [Limimaricola sp.]